jgi:hypothetical protein
MIHVDPLTMVMDSPDELAWLRRLATAVAVALVDGYARTR